MKKVYRYAMFCMVLACALCGCGVAVIHDTGEVLCGDSTDNEGNIVCEEQYEKVLLTPDSFKSEYDSREDAFNAYMQEKLKEVLEAEDCVEQADISSLDEKTITISLTYADHLTQEEKDTLGKQLERAVGIMLEDREIIVETKTQEESNR